jgi:hypothetical protein
MYGDTIDERCGPHRTAPTLMQQPEKHLALTLPDSPWQMIAVFANAMMSAQADRTYNAGHDERRSPSAIAMSPEAGHPGGHRCGNPPPRWVSNAAVGTPCAEPGEG